MDFYLQRENKDLLRQQNISLVSSLIIWSEFQRGIKRGGLRQWGELSFKVGRVVS